MIPDFRSSRGKSTTSEIGFYPGNLEERLTRLGGSIATVRLQRNSCRQSVTVSAGRHRVRDRMLW